MPVQIRPPITNAQPPPRAEIIQPQRAPTIQVSVPLHILAGALVRGLRLTPMAATEDERLHGHLVALAGILKDLNVRGRGRRPRHDA